MAQEGHSHPHAGHTGAQGDGGAAGAPTGLSPGGGGEDEQDREREGLRSPRHFQGEAGRGLGHGRILHPEMGSSLTPLLGLSAGAALCTPGPTSSFYWAQEDKCHQAPWQRGSYNPWEVAPLLSPGSATSTLQHPAATTSGTTSGTTAAAPLPRAGVNPRGG